MPLRLYNTRTRTVEPFRTLEPGHARIYVCGLTPSAEAHLGHAEAGARALQGQAAHPATLAGRHGILVIIRGADAHTAYSGTRDIKTKFASLAEVRVIEDFEGQVTLGLGLNESACYRASVLTNPVRLVIDTQVS